MHSLMHVFQVLDMVGMLAEVNELAVKIYPFQIMHQMLSKDSIAKRYATRVQHDLQSNLISIAGSYFGGLDILGMFTIILILCDFCMFVVVSNGNIMIYCSIGRPAGLIKNIHGGVTGLFYEPFQGIMDASPKAVLTGIGRGTTGLVTNVGTYLVKMDIVCTNL